MSEQVPKKPTEFELPPTDLADFVSSEKPVSEGIKKTENKLNDIEGKIKDLRKSLNNALETQAGEIHLDWAKKTVDDNIVYHYKTELEKAEKKRDELRDQTKLSDELPSLTKPEDLILDAEKPGQMISKKSEINDGIELPEQREFKNERDIEDIMTEMTFNEAGKIEEGPLPDLPPIESEEKEIKVEGGEQDKKSSEESGLEGEIIDAEKNPGEAKEINPELLLAAADKQGEKIDVEVKEKQNWIREKVEKTADWYKKRKTWEKVLFSVGCVGAAAGSVAVGGTAGLVIGSAAFVGKATQRMLGGLATFVTAEGFLKQQAEKGGKERTNAEVARHTVEAATLGILVGSGEAAKAIKELSDVTGFTDILKTFYDYWMPKTNVHGISEIHNSTEETIRQAEKNIAESKEILKASNEINELATVKNGEGIWHAVRRQLEEKIHGNPNAYGLKPEDLADEEKIKSIANQETGKLLTEQGYIKPDGTNTWVSHEGTKVLLGADNKIIISGEGDNLTYEVKAAPEIEKPEGGVLETGQPEVKIPETETAYVVSESEAIISKPEVTQPQMGEITVHDKAVANEFSSFDSAHESAQPEVVHEQPVVNEPIKIPETNNSVTESTYQQTPEIKDVTEVKTAYINNEIIQQHLEGENKVSEFVLNDKNLKDVRFKILIDSKGNSNVNFSGDFLNSTESVNNHLTDNYNEEIIKKTVGKPMGSQFGRTAVLAEARNLEIYERALKYLGNNGQGDSAESGILKNQIKRIIEGTEKIYGHVFVDKAEDFK